MFLGMTRGLVLHNAMQLSIPFWLTAIFMTKMPTLDFWAVGFWAVIGSVFPDVDHFSMWRKVDHKKGLFNFIKYCVQADRYRKAFLPFHNKIAILVTSIASGLFIFVNPYVSIFFAAFAVHLVFDLLADLYLIKQHTHWRIRNWLDESNSGLPIAQQIQPGNKQKHNA
jgi:hypothetical protein